jgi:hypothetical protein
MVAGSSPDLIIGFLSVDLILPAARPCGFSQSLTNNFQKQKKIEGSKAWMAYKAYRHLCERLSGQCGILNI